MPQLGSKKPMLLDQLRKQPVQDLQKLVDLLRNWTDLTPEDLRSVVGETMYEQLLEAGRPAEEVNLWNQLQSKLGAIESRQDIQEAMNLASAYITKFPSGRKIQDVQKVAAELPGMVDTIEQDRAWRELQTIDHSSVQSLQEAQRKVADFILRYPQGKHLVEAQALAKQLQDEIGVIVEEKDWNVLERGNYSSCLRYREKYPNSAHLKELDEFMWLNTKTAMTYQNLNRYLCDWPNGEHAAEARNAMDSFGEWEEVKRSKDIFRVDDYRDNHPDSPFINEVNSLYYKLRDEELQKMKENPSEYSKDDVERLLAADIFDRWQLEDEGLITEESWDMLQQDRDLFPNIQDYQVEDPDITAPEDCTDIYLFGTPGTGKTCLLMGLTGANGDADEKGQSYTLNMRVQGGPYAAALQEYVNAGITPGRTFGRFVTAINGTVTERVKSNLVDHKINLVEMSGEEFALRIADNKEVALANMGTGAVNLLRNQNRKVFFLIVDSTKDKIKVDYVEQVKDSDGNVIDERVRKKYISQLTILNKFVGLFELPENQEIMKKVDAIHFVVTKADMLGDGSVRKEKARDLLLTRYSGPVQTLKNYCRKTKRVNYSTNYAPQVFTFSLGQFYLGDVFSFDKTETVQIIDTIRTVTGGTTEEGFFGKLKRILG